MNSIKAWKKILNKIIEKGDSFIDLSGKENIELLNQKIVILDTKDCKLPMNKMMQQTDFIYPNIEQMQKLVLENKGLSTNFASRMLDFNGVNQLEDFIIPLLKKDPNTRRAVISTYNPLLDSTIDSKSAISILNFFFRIKNGALHLSIFIRSMDCFLGYPANLLQASIIQKEVSSKLGISCGSITFLVGSAHIYLDYEDTIQKILN